MQTFPTNPKTPTAAAIDTAIKNSVKMIGLYHVKESQSIPGMWFCIKNANDKDWYMVDTREGRKGCTCPQFAEEGACKHQVHVDDELRIRAEEEAAEEADL
jgi:hypothetical protein